MIIAVVEPASPTVAMATSSTTQCAMRATCHFGRSPTVANPKGFPQEVLLELHLWLTAWPLDHRHVEFEFEKEAFLLVEFLAWSGCFLVQNTGKFRLPFGDSILPNNHKRPFQWMCM